MTLTDGSDVVFVSCRDCEGRRWEHVGGTLPVQEVLTRAQRHR